jgi:hypothetical protein
MPFAFVRTSMLTRGLCLTASLARYCHIGLSFEVETTPKRDEDGELEVHQRFRTLGLNLSEHPLSGINDDEETEQERDIRNQMQQPSLESVDFVQTFDVGDGESIILLPACPHVFCRQHIHQDCALRR